MTLNVVTLDTAVKYLGARGNLIEDLIIRDKIDFTKVGDEVVFTEEQFNSLENVVEINGYRKESFKLVSVIELELYCLEHNYVSNLKVFNKHLDSGLFSGFKVTHPFNNMVFYINTVYSRITRAVERGGIETLSTEGYTKDALIKELGITQDNFMTLVNKLNIKPVLIDTLPVYTKDQSLSIKRLEEMLRTFKGKKTESIESSDTVFILDGKRYINKENVRLYVGAKYSTISYLNSIGAIYYRDIVYQGNVITVALQSDLDLLIKCLKEGLKPSLVASVLRGFTTIEDLKEYITRKEFVEGVVMLGIPRKTAESLVTNSYKPTLMIQKTPLYALTDLSKFAIKFVRGTHQVANLSVDYISAVRLAELVGKTAKNIKSYARKYLSDDFLMTRQGIYLRLDSYIRLQKSEINTTVLKRISDEESKCINLVSSVVN